jgi:hypothetical protein
MQLLVAARAVVTTQHLCPVWVLAAAGLEVLKKAVEAAQAKIFMLVGQALRSALSLKSATIPNLLPVVLLAGQTAVVVVGVEAVAAAAVEGVVGAEGMGTKSLVGTAILPCG